ncbi:hypothetical protein [Streptomyces sp. bgisy034]|uniref:hypothetical protein n=1 Tax=Streptomyces sp. bgisy034 TaxID=3413774 RepID=UPI003EB9CC17
MTTNAGHMAPRTAREAAELLAQQGKHSHLHAEHETVCISGHCTLVPTVLDISMRPEPTAISRYL